MCSMGKNSLRPHSGRLTVVDLARMLVWTRCAREADREYWQAHYDVLLDAMVNRIDPVVVERLDRPAGRPWRMFGPASLAGALAAVPRSERTPWATEAIRDVDLSVHSAWLRMCDARNLVAFVVADYVATLLNEAYPGIDTVVIDDRDPVSFDDRPLPSLLETLEHYRNER